MERVIYTIGHSTHPLDDFLEMLRSFGIKTLVDIRRLPGSRKYPQYDKENLETSLLSAGINYRHAEDLGGRRKPAKDTKNTRWNNSSFRGYADYMETAEFEKAVSKVEEIASSEPTVLMCAEAVWWRCHRSMVADYMKAKGWTVMHIMALGKSQQHKFTAPATVTNDRVSYHETE